MCGFIGVPILVFETRRPADGGLTLAKCGSLCPTRSFNSLGVRHSLCPLTA